MRAQKTDLSGRVLGGKQARSGRGKRALEFALAGGLCASVSPLAVNTASAEEFSPIGETANWKFTWGGYVHAAYRWITQPQNYNLAGRNNGFQLEQARIGANVDYKDKLAIRVSLEGASEDRINQAFPGGQITARLRDAYLTYGPFTALRISVGQMVTPWDLDSMRSDAELPFVSRSVVAEGVQPSEGRTVRGLGQDRNLGISIHSGDIPMGGPKASFRYSVLVGNGNGQNQLLNDNNLPAVFGRVEFSLWGKEGIPETHLGPMRARTDGRLPLFSLGLAGQFNPRTAGNPPDLLNETDVGGAVDVLAAFYGVDIEGGALYVNTKHDTLASVPNLERFGWWAHVRYTIPKIPVKLTPGYRIGSYSPRAHLGVAAATPADATADSSLDLLYHTIGLGIRPTESFPIHIDVNYTFTTEQAPNVLSNDRFEADVVAVF